MPGRRQTSRYLRASGEDVSVNQDPKFITADRTYRHVGDFAVAVY